MERFPKHFEKAMWMLTSKWSLRIVCVLMRSPMCFGELCRELPGISRKVLTENLRQMERNGVIARTCLSSEGGGQDGTGGISPVPARD
jgi:DNA-binding HxlR family transcriptional regulator